MSRSGHALSAENRRLLSRILDDAREKIHADYERAPSQFKAFFLYLEREIFKTCFKVSDARKAAKLKGNGYAARFRQLTGMSPQEYVAYHRITAARRMIHETDSYHWQIGYSVGFSDPSVFSRSYRRVLGHSPTKETKHGRCETTKESILEEYKSAARSKGFFSPKDPRVSEDTAEIDFSDPVDVNIHLDNRERSVNAWNSNMEAFWLEIQSLSRLEIKKYILNHLDDLELGHFHFISEKAKYEGRRDRVRGEELCFAALDTLRLVEFRRGEEFHEEKAIGYSSLGNACRLQFNFEDAWRWFRRADSFLPNDPEDKPLLFAKVNFLKVSLLLSQHDIEASLRLLKRILPDIRRYGSCSLLARALLLSGDIHDYSGHPNQAMECFKEAVALAEFVDDSHVIFTAHFNLTLFYTRLSMGPESATQLGEVYKVVEGVNEPMAPFFLQYLEGSVCRVALRYKEAELYFLEAKEGFLTQDMDIYAALVSLDLALLYLDVGEHEKALMEAAASIPVISRLGSHQEVITALAALQEAEQCQRIDKSILAKALNHLELFRKDPSSTMLREKR